MTTKLGIGMYQRKKTSNVTCPRDLATVRKSIAFLRGSLSRNFRRHYGCSVGAKDMGITPGVSRWKAHPEMVPSRSRLVKEDKVEFAISSRVRIDE
jgi:hypothetical protein